MGGGRGGREKHGPRGSHLLAGRSNHPGGGRRRAVLCLTHLLSLRSPQWPSHDFSILLTQTSATHLHTPHSPCTGTLSSHTTDTVAIRGKHLTCSSAPSSHSLAGILILSHPRTLTHPPVPRSGCQDQGQGRTQQFLQRLTCEDCCSE